MFLYLSAPECQKHSDGWGHPESAERIVAVENALLDAGLMDQAIRPAFHPAEDADILRVHPPRFLQTLQDNLPDSGFVKIDDDTSLNAGSLISARYASGAVLAAIDGVLGGTADTAFCNVRPPGHHAERNRPMGFCLINNIAIGAAYAMAHHGLERITIVDFDVHHGNGTEDYIHREPRVSYVSSFQDGIFPFTDPVSDLGNMLKLPLKAHSDGETFMQAWAEGFAFVRQCRPQLILVSAGFDAHRLDPLASLNLVEQDFYQWTQALVEIAAEACDGKIVSVLEGGYHLDALAASAVAHVKALFKT